jgi:hypothetical protein
VQILIATAVLAWSLIGADGSASGATAQGVAAMPLRLSIVPSYHTQHKPPATYLDWLFKQLVSHAQPKLLPAAFDGALPRESM